MDKALLFFGVIIIILGIVIFYLVITSFINLGLSIKEQSSTLPQLQENEIYLLTPISSVIVSIGVLMLKKAFEK